MNKAGQLTNPLFTSLEGQVITESHIFANKNDIYNFALSLVCKFCYKKEELNKMSSLLLKEAERALEDDPGISFLKEACLIYCVFSSEKRRVSRFRTFILENINNASGSTLSANTKGLIGYCLLDEYSSSTEIKTYIEQLCQKGNTELTEGNIERAIDFLFGCNDLTDNTKSRLPEALIQNANELTIERLSKGILTLIRIPNIDVTELLTVLEEKIQEDLTNWKTADIEFSLFEAHKLINSNIPNEHVNAILTALKKVNTNWAKLVNKIEEEGVYVDLKHFNKLPNFSPNNDVWALLALKEAGRQYSYQLSPSSYSEYVELRRDKDKGIYKIEGYSVLVLLAFSIFLTSVVFNLFLTQDPSLNNFAHLSIFSTDTPEDLWNLLLNPWLELTISVFWIYLLYNRLQKHGLLTLIDIIRTWPILAIVSSITGWFMHALAERRNES